MDHGLRPATPPPPQRMRAAAAAAAASHCYSQSLGHPRAVRPKFTADIELGGVDQEPQAEPAPQEADAVSKVVSSSQLKRSLQERAIRHRAFIGIPFGLVMLFA